MASQQTEGPYEQWQRGACAQVAELREMAARELKRGVGSDACVGGPGVALERRVQDIVNSLGRALMQEVFELADTTSPEVVVDGARWGYRRVQSSTYETTFGDVLQPRSTYQQAGRGRVSVPMELRLGIVEGRYTPLVARIANRSFASMPSNEAEQLLQEIGVCKLSRSTLHRLPQAIVAKLGPRLDEVDAHVRVSDAIPAEACTVQIGLDGVMVPVDGPDAKPRGRKTASPTAPRHETKYGVSSQLAWISTAPN